MESVEGTENWEKEEFGEKLLLKVGSARKRRKRERICSLLSLIRLATLRSRYGNKTRGYLPWGLLLQKCRFRWKTHECGGYEEPVSRMLDEGPEVCGSRRDPWRQNGEAQQGGFLVRQMDSQVGLGGALILGGAYVVPVSLFPYHLNYRGWNVNWGVLGRPNCCWMYQEVF